MRRMTGQLLLILYSFLFLLLSPADLNFVVGFLVSLICIGMQMFLKDDWERYVLLICILAGSWYCVGICEFLPFFLWILDRKRTGVSWYIAVAGRIFTGASGNVNLSHGQMYFLIVGILLSLVLKLKEEAYEELEQEYRKTVMTVRKGICFYRKRIAAWLRSRTMKYIRQHFRSEIALQEKFMTMWDICFQDASL